MPFGCLFFSQSFLMAVQSFTVGCTLLNSSGSSASTSFLLGKKCKYMVHFTVSLFCLVVCLRNISGALHVGTRPRYTDVHLVNQTIPSHLKKKLQERDFDQHVYPGTILEKKKEETGRVICD